MPRAAPRRHSGRARAVAIASSPSGSRTQQAEPAPTPKTRAAPFAPPFSDTDRPYAWPPPSEFEFAIDISVARNPGRGPGQPAGRSGRFGGPAGPPLVHSRRRRRARREGAGLAISMHCFMCFDHDHPGLRPRAPNGRRLRVGPAAFSGRTAQSGEGTPIRKAGPNRESQAGRERSGPPKPALR